MPVAKSEGGSYVLIIRLSRPCRLMIGKLGPREFAAGFYAYIGSALGGIEQRVARHQRKEKRLHWHIDYLLGRGRIREVIRLPGPEKEECRIASEYAGKFVSILGFGASDCRCGSHLFFLGANGP